MKKSKKNSEKQGLLVVGASRGIGRAVADYFEENNWDVYRAARSFKKNFDKEFNLDVSQSNSVKKLFTALKNTKLDLVVFSAGVGHFAALEKITEKQWNDCIEVNLNGAFRVAQASYQHFLSKNKAGKIFVIGSVADHLALKENAAYAASKFGLRGLISVLHEEGRSHSISTTLLSLGATYTDIWKSRPEYSPKDMLSPQEVAQTIYNLAILPSKVSIPSIVVTPPKGIL